MSSSVLWILAVLALAAAVGFALRLRREKDGTIVQAAGDPTPTRWFPLTVHYLVENCHRDRDQGMATFSEGWFLFEGARTRFALRAVDVRSVAPDGGDLEIVLKMERRSMLLKSERAFDRCLAAWYRASQTVEGVPTLPPLERGA